MNIVKLKLKIESFRIFVFLKDHFSDYLNYLIIMLVWDQVYLIKNIALIKIII